MLSPDSAVYLSTRAGKACALLCASSSTAESSSVRRRGRHSFCRLVWQKDQERIPGPKVKIPLLTGGRLLHLSFDEFARCVVFPQPVEPSSAVEFDNGDPAV